MKMLPWFIGIALFLVLREPWNGLAALSGYALSVLATRGQLAATWEKEPTAVNVAQGLGLLAWGAGVLAPAALGRAALLVLWGSLAFSLWRSPNGPLHPRLFVGVLLAFGLETLAR